MEGFDFDLNALEDDMTDVVLEDASTYQDQTAPAPIAPGNYKVRVVAGGRKKDSDGSPIDDHGYPQVVLAQLSIVEPEDIKRDIFPFQTYSSRPVQGGRRQGSVPTVDLLRGFDDQLTFANGKEALSLLIEQIAAGRAITVATNWIAKDTEAIKEFIEENGGDLDGVDAEEKREFFARAIFRGQKRFPKVNGVYVPEVEGPSGAKLEARAYIARIYPSSKVVKKLGAFRTRTV